MWFPTEGGVEIEFKKGEPVIIEANHRKLVQAFYNILKNSLEAGAKTIRLDYGQNGSDKCVISVEDNGSGMDNDTRKRIYEPFFTTKKIGRGTGLGMSVSYGIIQEHGGSIEVQSEPGKGTRTKIILPLAMERK
jgi:signal transduction histidine kinase